MSIKAKQLSRRLSNLRGSLDVIAKQHRCDLTQAVSIFKALHETAGKQLSEEKMMDLELVLEESAKAPVIA